VASTAASPAAGVSGAAAALERWLSRRWVAVGCLLVFGLVIVFPTLIVLPPDDEGLFTDVESTFFRAHHLLDAFWNPFVGLGVPHPLSENLTFHPIVLLLAAGAPIGFSLALLYLVQIWIGLLSIWAVCRYLGIRPWISLLCAVTFGLCSGTITYLTDFWPAQMVEWTLAPLLLYLLLRFLDSEGTERRLGYAVATGLLAGLILDNGHSGVYPYVAIGTIAFLAGSFRRLLRVWPWALLSLLVFALVSATKIYDIGLEAVRGDAPRPQQIYPMAWWRLFFYPIDSPLSNEARGDRLIALGGPFVLLAVAGLVLVRLVRGRYTNGLRVGVVVCFVGWFVSIPIVSGTWYSREPLMLFSIALAGLTLEALWANFPRYRPLLGLLAVLQVVVLAVGFYSPYYRHNLARAVHYLRGHENTPTLRTELKNQPIYRWFEQQPDHRLTRAYMAPGAEDRLYRTLESLVNNNSADHTDYEFAGWSLHGLRLVNGHFKGTDLTELSPPDERLHSQLRAEPTLPRAARALDVLDVGYVLATPQDRISPSLVRTHTFRVQGGDVIEVYRNPDHWQDVAVLDPRAKQVGTLPLRAGCTTDGLMCADFSSVKKLGHDGAIASERWDGTTLHVRFAPGARPGVLMLSQLHRPGWQAHLSNGRTVNGYELFGGLTGFDLPAGVTSAEISFRPTARMALAYTAWAAILVSLGLLVAIVVRARRRGTRDASG
jgi:hypothetical protein